MICESSVLWINTLYPHKNKVSQNESDLLYCEIGTVLRKMDKLYHPSGGNSKGAEFGKENWKNNCWISVM